MMKSSDILAVQQIRLPEGAREKSNGVKLRTSSLYAQNMNENSVAWLNKQP